MTRDLRFAAHACDWLKLAFCATIQPIEATQLAIVESRAEILWEGMQMHVIWKRPDGFHGAKPSDFEALRIGEQAAMLWLHQSEIEWYPFQVSGDWEESDSTRRLNFYVNLLRKDERTWLKELIRIYHNSMSDKPEAFLSDLQQWMLGLRVHLKGDKWEVEIMTLVIEEIVKRLQGLRPEFITTANH